MTAPSTVITRIWHVDLATAQRFQAFEKTPQRGVEGTNRKHSDRIVNEYAWELLSGNWGFSHQGFAFIGRINDGSAQLVDGGQRIRALIQACTVGATMGDETKPPNPDCAMDVMVTEGLDEDAWLVMDLGKGRLPGDFLSMNGEINTSLLGSVINLCYRYEHGGVGVPYLRDHWYKGKLSPTVRKRYLEENPTLREALPEGARLHRVMTPTAACAGYFLATKAGVDKQELQNFMDDLRAGAGDDWTKGNPIFTLREMLRKARDVHRKLGSEEQLALFIKAVNANTKGYKILNLSFKTRKSSTGAAAEAFPRFSIS